MFDHVLRSACARGGNASLNATMQWPGGNDKIAVVTQPMRAAKAYFSQLMTAYLLEGASWAVAETHRNRSRANQAIAVFRASRRNWGRALGHHMLEIANHTNEIVMAFDLKSDAQDIEAISSKEAATMVRRGTRSIHSMSFQTWSDLK
ncbi:MULTISPECIES: hypothetical protein [unclassified Bradyrhizobium]|uniref:hypothetical protein n=1 Tax=unclassified Bradyrhizobium TaxID=2631580 RepID=UPI0028E69B1A|nr:MULTISPECIES: hypothetical protein [unclassified Bradyrhizobium]